MAAAIAFGGVLIYATVDAWHAPRALPPTPPEVTRDFVVRSAADTHGNRASFRILLFTDEYRWRLSSVDTLSTGSSSPVFTPEMSRVLEDAEEIICVGTSSEEFPSGVSVKTGQLLEEQRAARRADQIAMWVRSSLAKPVPIRKLNAGYHQPTDALSRDTSDERRVVIILVLDHDKDTNIDEALQAAMQDEGSRAPIFDSLLTQYSLSSRRPFTWIP
jgi:hypothetical protein